MALLGRIITEAQRESLRNAAAIGREMVSDVRVMSARRQGASPEWFWGFDVGSATCKGSDTDGPGQATVRTQIGPVGGVGINGMGEGTTAAVNGFLAAQAAQFAITRSGPATAPAANPLQLARPAATPFFNQSAPSFAVPVSPSIQKPAPSFAVPIAAPVQSPFAVAVIPPVLSTGPAIAPQSMQPAPSPVPMRPVYQPVSQPTQSTYSPVSQPAQQQWSPPPTWDEVQSTTAESRLTKSGGAALQAAIDPDLKPKLSLWHRILVFLHIEKAPATMGAESTSRVGLAHATVRAARNGDQNAMALMAAVRDDAAKGNFQAQVSMKLMQEYINQNPVGSATFAADPRADMLARRATSIAVCLADGPPLSNASIGLLADRARFSGETREAFFSGVVGAMPKSRPTPPIREAHRAGTIVAVARKLQALRAPSVRVGSVDANLGWELGE